MSTLSPLGYSLRSWFWQACAELTKFFEQMTVTQYAILATATVAFGFLCLKGYTIRR